ncbi:MAG: DUF2177 family protein [Phenylobacterium sp.]|uniref:DUF2177 family protein n=1 Tax=Phenylobacterium sp. TaxID=1871053 RepID=UPI003918BF1F
MRRYAVGYLAAGLAMGLLDAVWLTQVGPYLYRPALDPVLADAFRPVPALAFYLAYVAGVMLLAVRPALREGTIRAAATNGALLGAMAYATYDLTNQATLKVWSTTITVIDVTWGATLTAVAAAAGFEAMRRLGAIRS